MTHENRHRYRRPRVLTQLSAIAGCLALVTTAGCVGNTKSAGSAPQTHAPAAAPSTSMPPPGGSSSAAAAPTVAPCGNPEGGSCLGQLSPGKYTTEVFDPAITYTVPPGWDNEEDLPGNFLLIPPGGDLPGVNAGTSDFVGIYSSVVAPNGCEDGPAPHVGTTAAALTAWIVHDTSLTVTAKHAVRVGGLTGAVMDLVVSARAKPCPYSNGNPVAPYLLGAGISSLEHNTGPGQKTRLYLLDHAGEALAIEVVDVHGGRDLEPHSAVTLKLSFAR